jgi:hypothetical protein
MDLTCASLMIDKIVINNFKSFLGKNKIILGHSPEKYVNIIEGPCGSGKTTIVDALRWAFSQGNQDISTQDPFLINHQLLKSLKNHQNVEVSVQVFLSEANSDRRLKIERTCEYSFVNEDLSLVSDVRAVKELRKSRWIEVDCEIPFELDLLAFWNGDQNPTNLMENLVSSVSKKSNSSNKGIKDIVSSVVLHRIKKIYPNFEFTVDFDDNEILHVKHGNCDYLPVLSRADLIVLWLSLLAGIRKSTKCQLPLILDSPFSRLDIMHRTSVINFLKDTIRSGQLICIGSELEFEPVMDILKPITNCHYRLGN